MLPPKGSWSDLECRFQIPICSFWEGSVYVCGNQTEIMMIQILLIFIIIIILKPKIIFIVIIIIKLTIK